MLCISGDGAVRGLGAVHCFEVRDQRVAEQSWTIIVFDVFLDLAEFAWHGAQSWDVRSLWKLLELQKLIYHFLPSISFRRLAGVVMIRSARSPRCSWS